MQKTELTKIALRIIDYRAKHNLSMEKFAKKCNLSTQTIYSIEKGLQEPTRITRSKILAVIEKEEK